MPVSQKIGEGVRIARQRNSSRWYAPLSERFHRLYTKNTDECWIWFGAKDRKGYPQINDGKTRYATHISLELVGQMRPSNKHYALHKCDTPACVNPNHLWWGTAKENSLDMTAKGRNNPVGLSRAIIAAAAMQRSKTHCKRGHSLKNAPVYNGCRACLPCKALLKREHRADVKVSAASVDDALAIVKRWGWVA